MKYILKEDYDRNDFSKLIEVENTKELKSRLGNIKGYGIDVCPDERVDGIIYLQK